MSFLQWMLDIHLQIRLLSILIVAVIFHVLLKRILKRYTVPRTTKQHKIWTTILAASIEKPLLWMIWVLSALTALEWILENTHPSELIFKYLHHCAITFLFTWMAFRAKNLIAHYVIEHQLLSTDSKSTTDTLSKFATLLILFICVLQLLSVFDIPLSNLLTLGGIGGLAFAWAAKDFIANMFGGLTLYISRPFAVGDHIKFHNKSFEGIVEHMGWYLTKLYDLEHQPKFVPNALFSNQIIENLSRIQERGFSQTFALDCKDYKKVPALTADILAMIQRLERVTADPPVNAHIVGFGMGTLLLKIECYFSIQDRLVFRTLQQEILLEIGKLMEVHQIKPCLSSSTVLLSNL